nr:alkylated DNA repair protein alkB homolog 8 [Neomonachus schauinslandi]
MAAPGTVMDSNHQSSYKLSKTEKKFLRKQIKARHTLLRHEGIETVSCATRSLVVANGGLGNNVSRNQLLPMLEKCGLVDALLMPPNKPYAFVRYKTAEEAKKAYVTLNGKEIVDDLGQKIILYLNFVEKAQWKELGLQALPPGLMVVEEIISSEDEKILLESVNWTEDVDSRNVQKSLKHRRVKHFGYEFHYENNSVDKDKPLPGGLPDIWDSILEKWLKEGFIKHKPDQLTVNQYEPGHGIPAHIDTHSAFEEEIVSLSLGSEIVMDFKHPDGVTVPVMLPRRSLLVMTGESRYLWTHGITPRKFDTVQASKGHRSGIITSDVGDLTLSKRRIRTSFTFRKVRRTPCNCSYPLVCDSQMKETLPSFPESAREALQLEREYVHRVYEEIAEHFSSTRHTPWPRVVDFLKALPSGSLVADVGCGNGKYLGINKELYMVGCDRSQALVGICRERRLEALVGDALAVPLRGGSWDACISVAVTHHLATAVSAALSAGTGSSERGAPGADARVAFPPSPPPARALPIAGGDQACAALALAGPHAAFGAARFCPAGPSAPHPRPASRSQALGLLLNGEEQGQFVEVSEVVCEVFGILGREYSALKINFCCACY